MNTETRAFLEERLDLLATKSDMATLQGDLLAVESRLVHRIDESQEALARMVNRSVAHSQTEFGEVRTRLQALGEAVDAHTWAGFVEADTLRLHRTDINSLARRVRALEEKRSSS